MAEKEGKSAMVTQRVIYVTEDGKEFKTLDEATAHECKRNLAMWLMNNSSLSLIDCSCLYTDDVHDLIDWIDANWDEFKKRMGRDG